jgi:hypothetical protein
MAVRFFEMSFYKVYSQITNRSFDGLKCSSLFNLIINIMKDLKNLKGAKVISKMEQKVIKGGKVVGIYCTPTIPCPDGYGCNTITWNCIQY